MNQDYFVNKLFLKNGLYQLENINDTDIEFFSNIFNFSYRSNLQFDCYCIECHRDSTFVMHHTNKSDPSVYSPERVALLERMETKVSPHFFIFKCQRNSDHFYHFSFMIQDRVIIKTGQYPSLADIEAASIKKYRSVLKKDYQDFAKAIGLYSHGIGIGSFVYLRRIFENLIEEKHQEKISDPTWNEEEFQRARMDSKINMLKDELPDILVQNRNLYGIISKGIHELSEEDCKELFPEIQVAIELILDEKIYMSEKLNKAKKVSSFISAAAEKFK